MNLYLRELRANLQSLLIWSGIMILLVVIAMAKFAAYAENPEMLAILDAMPKPLLDAMNMHAFNLTTLNGFLGVMFLYYGLLGAIAAGLWGSGTMTREARRKTLEFSLTLPISRGRWLLTKTLAAFTLSLLYVLVTWGTTLMAMRSYHPDATVHAFLAREMIAMLALETIFLALGLLVAAASPNPKRASSIVIGLIFTTFYLSMLSGLHEKLTFLQYLTPFKYFDPAALLHQGNVDSIYWMLTAGILVLSLVGAHLTFSRKDIAW